MKTVALKLYKFNELDKEIQKKVINNYRYNEYGYMFIDDDIKVIQDFANDFGINIYNYALSPYHHSYFKYDFDNFDKDNFDISKLDSDEPLYEILLDEFKKQYNYSYDYKTAFDMTMQRAIKYITDEMEYQDSDEYITETINLNDYDFTIDGKIY